jgi:AcrR family transcriptional regulator
MSGPGEADEATSQDCRAQHGEGLRARKRRRVRDDTHRAALELVAERGLGNVTVEMISERAGVSPRTFFNHWSTKETAILGISADDANELPVQFRRRPAEEGARDALRAAMRETVDVDLDVADGAQDLRALRKKVMQQEPQLHAISAGRTARMQVDLVAAYEERLVSTGEVPAEDDGTLPGGLGVHGRAVVAVQLAFALLHSAFILSMSHGTRMVDELDELLAYEDSELLRF